MAAAAIGSITAAAPMTRITGSLAGCCSAGDEELAIGGELYHETAQTIGGEDTTGFNIGGVYDIDDHNHLLFSAGRAIENASETNLYSWYVAIRSGTVRPRNPTRPAVCGFNAEVVRLFRCR